MRYISDSVISFSIVPEGSSKSVRVSFSSHSNGGSTFSTESEPLIKAMEKSEMFGRIYRRASECVDVKVGVKARTPKAAAPVLKSVPNVTTWQEAAEYLKENEGVDADLIKTPASILKAATDKGIKFEELNA